jgi:hypothetical protein
MDVPTAIEPVTSAMRHPGALDMLISASVPRAPKSEGLADSLVYLLGREQDNRLRGDGANLIAGEHGRVCRHIVQQIDDDVGVDAEESEKEGIELAARGLDQPGGRGAAARAAFVSKAFRALGGRRARALPSALRASGSGSSASWITRQK